MNKLDILSPSPMFFSNSKKRHVSHFGGFLTVLLFCLSIAMIIVFGWDLFVREAPEVSFSKAFNESPSLNKEDFSLSTTIQYAGGFPIQEMERKLDFGIQVIDTDASRPVDEVSKYYKFKMKPCPETIYFKENRNNIASAVIGPPENYYCPPDEMDYEMEGRFGTNKFKLINYYISYCTEREDCYSQEFIANNLTDVFFHAVFSDYYADSFDFSSPVKENLNAILLPVSSEFKQDFSITFEELDFFDEQGWVFAKKTESKRHVMESYTFGIDKLDQSMNIARVMASFGNFKQVYVRKYIKLQDAVAQASAVIKFITVLFQAALQVYSYFTVNFAKMRIYTKENSKLPSANFRSSPSESVVAIRSQKTLDHTNKRQNISQFNAIYKKIMSEDNLFEICALHAMRSKETEMQNRTEIAKYIANKLNT